jgi:hypothetical protein
LCLWTLSIIWCLKTKKKYIYIYIYIYIDKKTKNLNRSINKTSTYISHKDQITNHRATNIDTHIHT